MVANQRTPSKAKTRRLSFPRWQTAARQTPRPRPSGTAGPCQTPRLTHAGTAGLRQEKTAARLKENPAALAWTARGESRSRLPVVGTPTAITRGCQNTGTETCAAPISTNRAAQTALRPRERPAPSNSRSVRIRMDRTANVTPTAAPARLMPGPINPCRAYGDARTDRIRPPAPPSLPTSTAAAPHPRIRSSSATTPTSTTSAPPPAIAGPATGNAPRAPNGLKTERNCGDASSPRREEGE
jgi:hypothetical protein